jgi:dienelactone hydrolase
MQGSSRQQLVAHDACQGSQIGVIGFSLGGMYGVWMAHAQPEQVAAVVLFYGAGMLEETNTQASYLGHLRPTIRMKMTIIGMNLNSA